MRLSLAVTLALVLPLLGAAQGADPDGDRLNGEQETLLGTNPALADSDGDGLDDGTEYWLRWTDPTQVDTDQDGISDAQDPFPTWLGYSDLSGVTTSTDRVLDQDGGRTLNQRVQVAVGNVITIDWFNHLSSEFTLESADFTIAYDFIDPSQRDFQDDGYYRVSPDGQSVSVRMPGAREVVEVNTGWRPATMTISDWPYHLYSEPIDVGQSWDFNVFYHEFLPQGEDPYFTGRAQVMRKEVFPLQTKLGRHEVEVYVVEATLTHATFNDAFFKAFLGPDPVLRTLVYLSVEHSVVLRYTTPYFRITPSKQVGFSDFIVQR